MPLNVKAGGSWRTASKVYAKVAGAWVTAKELWGYMNGGWRSAWKNEIRYINTSNRTAASIFELMGSPTQPGTYVFENQATISAGTGSYALRTGVFPAGSILKIVNNGYIVGKGGAGGVGNTTGASGVGQSGGTALYIDFPCSIETAAGYIFGGGGGGGGAYGYDTSASYVYCPGGGGAGGNAGAAGAGFGHDRGFGRQVSRAPAGGTLNAGGLGAAVEMALSATEYIFTYGGDGGGPGTAGQAGRVQDSTIAKKTRVAHAGGSAGAAITKNGHAVSILSGNDTTHIKGAVI